MSAKHLTIWGYLVLLISCIAISYEETHLSTPPLLFAFDIISCLLGFAFLEIAWKRDIHKEGKNYLIETMIKPAVFLLLVSVVFVIIRDTFQI
jgi:hypothetical protein